MEVIDMTRVLRCRSSSFGRREVEFRRRQNEVVSNKYFSFRLFSGLGGVGSNSIGLQVNGLDLCMVHKDFPYAP